MQGLNEKDFTSILTQTFKDNGLSSLLSRSVTDKFYRLTVRMLEENEKYNLTAITDPQKIVLNHYADCATLSSHLKTGASVIDVGCGAGFPSLPLAIVRPDLKITAIDSTAKRVNYVDETAKQLGIDNVKALVMRAEDGGKQPAMRECYDYATARAVAELRILCELCLPYVKQGGKMIAMKGKNAELELSAAKRAIAMLGGRRQRCESITLTAQDGEIATHPLVVIDKAEKTPQTYPRPYAQISKKPL